MKIVCAPDKFKGCLDARAVARAMADGIRRVVPDADIIERPMSDGGDGFVQTIIDAGGGSIVHRNVTGPLPEMRVDAPIGLLPDGITAVIECAAASGVAVVPPELRNPLATTTHGTGELIAHAAALGHTRIIVGLGGSATCDGGIGMAQACGLQIAMDDGEALHPGEPLCGRDLPRVRLIKHGRGSVVDGCQAIGAADVSNPLLGPHGAATVFSPQKGASPTDVQFLEASMRQLVARHDAAEIAAQPRTGAAGGLGFGIVRFLGGRLESGSLMAARLCGLGGGWVDADLCLTGEGRVDATSVAGKVCGLIASLAADNGVPCIVLAGDVRESGNELGGGTAVCLSIVDRPMTEAEAMRDASELITSAAERAVRCFIAAKR